MSGEILFRGQDKKGNWHYGDLVHEAFDGTSANIEVGIREKINGHYCYPVEVIPDTAGQFTGTLKGVDVFVGDECSFIHNTFQGDIQYKGVVKYIDFMFVLITGFDDKLQKETGVTLQFIQNSAHVSDFKVIGNIHDNPELLKQENQ